MRLGELISAENDLDCHCGLPVFSHKDKMCPSCIKANCTLPYFRNQRVECILKPNLRKRYGRR